jgi:ribonucleoside-triphosphate reductase
MEPAFGPTGQIVYERTYQRVKANGDKENWADTINRVVNGNLALVDSRFIEDGEREKLVELFYNFKALPAGRQLWASGVPGRQFLFNCHVSGWGDKFSDHAQFTFLRLMEGGGVGSNYSTKYLNKYPRSNHELRVHIVCDPDHPDYSAMSDAGLLSKEFSPEWPGAYSVEDSREGWANALVDFIDTFYRDDVKHTDRVYDVSRVRAAGAKLRTFGGVASGPLPFAQMLVTIDNVMGDLASDSITPLDAMAIDHAIAECVVSGGVRRSARMSIVHWNDPYVFEFIKAKEDGMHNWTTNISIEIDQDFFDAINASRNSLESIKAVNVLQQVASRMLKNGEPGFWNSALSNVDEPNPVISTNPCGEIALQEWENCNLGHINMEAFHGVDESELHEAHRLMTRFLIRSTFGDIADDKQQRIVNDNRRIGVGHFGVQGFLAKQGIRFSEATGTGFSDLLRSLKQTVRDTARRYSFQLRIPEPVKVTTVAPTGTIAKLAGATEGIHPIYARYFNRRVQFSNVGDAEQITKLQYDGYYSEPSIYAYNTTVIELPTKEKLVQEVEDLGIDPSIVESADEISLNDMLAFQAMYQSEYADNAVSFTANVPRDRYSTSELVGILREYLPVLKGTTIMVDESRAQAPYQRISKDELDLALYTVEQSYDENCKNGACPVK